MSTLAEARAILTAFGFDAARSNEAAGRTLLALASQDAGTSWAVATNRRMGIRAMLDWMRVRLEHPIAENTREQIRRFVMHQFIECGFCVHNDDDPSRATNSSLNNYRLADEALAVIRLYGTPAFDREVTDYLVEAPGLAAKYAAARELARIPIILPDGFEITLKAGGQNGLIKAMIDDFCAYFIPGGEILYIGDADSKLLHFDDEKLELLGVVLDTHGKLPDLVVYQQAKNWLFLIEAASSHGPVDAKRYGELATLFAGSTAGLVYVSCFPDRATMRRFFVDLAWETEAWCASDPTHMIHLNGDRFLGPYGG
ncbi:BsuBI/PstI family type II restriction endonuclease [Rathayibacter rathayi]|uniref:Restriction endonuclease n=1 Tax=Rathayibacter rathayi TaxID=33887 RepID=A0ABD6WCE4_RATRA|nr:BsuBI/PstI family type II restriction endonuclease [Rathayibacter rathayi]AZZ49210.1 restriction endonuclease [Rathayibacter rathayi]MWV73273.1 restriction endonuclease [Rathayibacter rathayi NCPPB 2980 = VKM Ac-1601]PPF16358.1 restriction endonuclease [Rathayibacter rathayi]PPF25628.1 restriction endonuclease [Rathayibacter rathayi]PPF51933.1 restriction endonuclease [Rathayibacter rathayi]